MYRKNVVVTRLSIVLTYVFLIVSIPMSNPIFMPIMHMAEHDISEAFSKQEAPESQDHHAASDLCCIECCPFCSFIAVHSVSAVPYGDNEKIFNSNPVIQSVDIKSITPPPKA